MKKTKENKGMKKREELTKGRVPSLAECLLGYGRTDNEKRMEDFVRRMNQDEDADSAPEINDPTVGCGEAGTD